MKQMLGLLIIIGIFSTFAYLCYKDTGDLKLALLIFLGLPLAGLLLAIGFYLIKS